ncbi:hypothetical protein D6C78_02594 [Aureobasidium pullulans]|uniref:Cell wall proline rich protein n=2 Tax=Aureobasidium pullulans TaxID=5580 RepID=A0A4S9ZGL7_AURPU|nr:hypothetical protein D6D20_05394 [Aureobasidium pullulans]THY03076.1 hypothetical protein D6D03_04627 [Aureobasidium pullulans]THZ31319.1 hypothetical protein D6C89_00949 [Aureobasidium pullulans]THZ74617.1 hypothetical protein D6C85_03362 [Aureobasidium pullulans]TIA04774.1 hypothetical protein D6C82_00600 [Aureobasidium pullulans]
MATTMSFRHHMSDQHYRSDQETLQLVPDFVFPPRPTTEQSTSSNPRRPASMNLAPSGYHGRSRSMRQSTSALPTFSFNSSDTSGRLDNQPSSPTTLTPPTSPPKSAGHRRGASELVGGDSRMGIGGMLGPSPSRHLDTLPLPDTSGSPAKRRGHAHRRSAAISGHDLASILQPRDVNVRPQTSVPQTPTEQILQPQYPSPAKPLCEERKSSDSLKTVFSPSGCIADEPIARPPSRPRVGFSEKIEFIPRPLSTVSADTASSVSTVRGHSGANSMSSLISLGGIGNPSPRRTMITIPDLASEVSPRSMPPIEPEVVANAEPITQRSPPSFNLHNSSLSFAPEATSDSPRLSKKKTFLKLDRRRSEPLISLTASADIGTSTISLQEPVVSDDSQIPCRKSEIHDQGLHRESSRKRVKKWATSILGRKAKDSKKFKQTCDAAEGSESGEQTPDLGPQLAEPFGEEPDLDALFGQDPFTDADDITSPSILSPRSEISDSFFPFFSSSSSGGEDTSPVIDLDAALGPYGTPTMSWEQSRPAPKRRQLHSSRLARDFVGPGMHYHRRTESAPALVPFEFAGRASSPAQSPMDDVFEEEEDESAVDGVKDLSICETSSQADEELGTGIQVVDAANEQLEHNFDWSFDDGLGIESQGSLRGAQSHDYIQHMPTPPRTSVVEDTIIEEATSGIAADYEEPRTSSVTKSSDSSGARTISAEVTGLGLPQSQTVPLTPTSNVASTFSSPDLARNQGSFDALRLGTSASSIGDARTMSSFTTAEPTPELYMSTDDVPSLTSSRSTMISTMYQTSPRRETMERPVSVACGKGQADVQASERRRKRSSIQSLSMLLGGSFGESRHSLRTEQRPQTAIAPSVHDESKRKKEHRLSKLMFWRSKSDSRSNPFQSK